jgi:hypothetical protein
MPVPATGTPSDAVIAAARRLAVDRLTGQVVSALREGGVASILLKGPATTRWLYDESRQRRYRDIDLLIAASDFRAAEVILENMGFSYALAAVLPSEEVPHTRRWLVPGQWISVDLHHTLPGIGAQGDAVWTVLSRDLEQASVGGVVVDVLDEAGRAFLLALHAASHGERVEQPLEDLARALERVARPVWHQAGSLALELDAVAAFTTGLALLPEGRAVAAEIGAPQNVPVGVLLRASSPADTAFGFERLAATRGSRAKAALLGREIVPTPSFMRVWSPLARRGRLGLGLAYLWRPVWLLLNAASGIKAWRGAVKKSR